MSDIDFIASERDLLEGSCWALQDSRRNLREALRAIVRCSAPGMHGSMASIATAAIEVDDKDEKPAHPLISQEDARALLDALKGLVRLRDNTPADEFEAYQAMFKSGGSAEWNAAISAIETVEGRS